MLQVEVFFHWLAVAFYGTSGVLLALGLVFQREWLLRLGLGAVLTGFIIHTAALGLRWAESGHGPWSRRYEVYSASVWAAVGGYLVAVWRRTSLGPLGALVMPAAFLLLWLGVTSPSKIQTIPPTYSMIWTPVHAYAGALAFAGCLVGTALAGLYLLQRYARPDSPVHARLPDPGVLDDLSYRALALGFIALGVMIISGAIWANSAWGRYWGWDPVETWSLISWVVYGIYFHLRRIHGWRGTRAAWFAVGALAVAIFAMFGLGVVYPGSEHSPYLSD